MHKKTGHIAPFSNFGFSISSRAGWAIARFSDDEEAGDQRRGDQDSDKRFVSAFKFRIIFADSGYPINSGRSRLCEVLLGLS
ncbi:hypothetical protein A8B75_19005 [Sphingomonadales bacterium EhC05]|jgi:hypothetical protein|nr:hypothetical protein A8B75_19005 [Sphingomonadales bacterium EhC05]